MKRNNKILISLIIIFIFILTACRGEYIEKEVLVRTERIRVEDDELFEIKEYEYDNYGRMTREVWRKEGDTLSLDDILEERIWEYDRRGNLIYEYYLSRFMAYYEEESEYKYDKQDRKIEEKTSRQGSGFRESNYHHKWTYDDKDRVIERLSFDRNGEVSWRRVFEYDDNGNMILDRSYDYDGSIASERIWEYNQYGEVSYDYYVDKNFKQSEKIIREFDDDGNKIREDEFKNGQLISEKIYNEQGYQIIGRGYKDGVIDYDNIYTYDKRGNRIEGVIRDKNGNIKMKIENKYDDNNNHIEEIRKDAYNNIILIQKWEHDKNNNRTRYVTIREGKKSADWIWEYDEYGNEIYHAQKDHDGNIMKWEAFEWYPSGERKMRNTNLIPEGRIIETFDKEGNNIERTRIFGGEIDYWGKYIHDEEGKRIKRVSGPDIGVKDSIEYFNYKIIKVRE
ncbi:hypothetical protein [Natronospora cellulosivora (SeqCode)]